MTTFLVSDLHLDPSRPDVISSFTGFLKTTAREAGSLYILGDLFEFWIGDDQAEPAFETVKVAMKACRDSGTRIFLMHGNRDFLIGESFCNQAGCTLLDEPACVELCGTTTLLMHGDSLCLDDHDYQAFRRRVRDKSWQQRFLQLGVDERLQTARRMRANSSRLNSVEREDIMDVNQDEVRRVMNRFGANRLVHGHTHRPGNWPLSLDHGPAMRHVLGDWHERGHVLAIDPKGQVDSLYIPLAPG